MPLENDRLCRIASYFGRAAGRHGHFGGGRNALVREMLALLKRLEADNPPELAGLSEQQILSMVAKSVLGKDQRDRSGRTEPLGSADFARGDDDPAIIVDREERREILRPWGKRSRILPNSNGPWWWTFTGRVSPRRMSHAASQGPGSGSMMISTRSSGFSPASWDTFETFTCRADEEATRLHTKETVHGIKGIFR